MATSAVVFVATFAVGNFDHLFATKMYAYLFISSGRGPAKSKCTSSLGSTTGSIYYKCFFPLIGLRFLPCSVQCLPLWAIWTIDRCTCGNHTCWHRSSMAANPWCVRCRLSRVVWRSCVGTKIRASFSRESSRTRRQFLIL